MPITLHANFDSEFESADGTYQTGGSYAEPGAYLAKVAVVKEGTTPNGATYIDLQWEVVSLVTGNATDQTGRTSNQTVWTTEKSMKHLAALLKNLNIKVSDRQVFNPKVFVGRFGCIEVSEESYTKKDGSVGTIKKVSMVIPPVDESLNKDFRDASSNEYDLPF